MIQYDADIQEHNRRVTAGIEERARLARATEPDRLRERIAEINDTLRIQAGEIAHYAKSMNDMAEVVARIPVAAQQGGASSVSDDVQNLGPRLGQILTRLPRATSQYSALVSERDELLVKLNALRQGSSRTQSLL